MKKLFKNLGGFGLFMDAYGSRASNQFARNVVIFYAEKAGELRLTMRTALGREGFERLRDFSNLDEMRAVLNTTSPDLIIIDSELPDCSKLIRDIRFGRLGDNPFLPIIATFWSPSVEFAQEMAGCGPDDMLIKPFSPGKLLDRVNVLVDRRKPFVVTSNYIGPDRRKDPTRAGSDANFIEVPNTLAAKMKGQTVKPDEIQQAIQSAQKEVNEMKMQRNAFQISFIVALIKQRLEKGDTSSDLLEKLRLLKKMSDDIGNRLKQTRFAHVAELSSSMSRVADSLIDNLHNPGAKDIELLKPLADAILLAFNPENDAADMAGQITSAVDTYRKRQVVKQKSAG